MMVMIPGSDVDTPGFWWVYSFWNVAQGPQCPRKPQRKWSGFWCQGGAAVERFCSKLGLKKTCKLKVPGQLLNMEVTGVRGRELFKGKHGLSWRYRINNDFTRVWSQTIILRKKVVPDPGKCRGLEPTEHESSLFIKRVNSNHANYNKVFSCAREWC